MLASLHMSPLDSLMTRLKAIASDATNSGYGTVSTDAQTLDFTIARLKHGGALESFESFVQRVETYRQPGDVLTWQMADREYVLCRITRHH
ncbi:MAG: hypothetical protein M3R61_00070 [Chloroflexota bacterium]|nr:hypothetical protein [Chloroflexota bacterium]